MKLKNLIRYIVSLTALVIVFRIVDFNALATTLSTLSLPYAALIVLVYVCGQLLSSLKWWLLARSSGIDVPWSRAIRAYFIGMFVNIAGVGTIGGDVTRGMLLSPATPHDPIHARVVGVTTVVADRLHGLAVLSGIGLLSVIIFGVQSLPSWLIWVLILFASAVLVGWSIGPRIVLALFPQHNRFRAKVERITKAFPRDFSTIALCTAVSIVFHLSQISLHKIMGLALGIDVPWSLLFVACPFSNIVSTLPISFQGLGVRENAYRFFFVTTGALTTEQAVAFGAMWFCAMTISGSIGGLLAIGSEEFEGLNNQKVKEVDQRIEDTVS